MVQEVQESRKYAKNLQKAPQMEDYAFVINGCTNSDPLILNTTRTQLVPKGDSELKSTYTLL